MTETAVELITGQLLTVREVFSRLEPQEMAQQLRPHMLPHMRRVLDTTAATHAPGMWGVLSESMRTSLTQRALDHGLPYVALVFQDLQDDIENVFDLKQFCIDTLMQDVGLIVDIFQQCGAKEFDFIRRSGLYLGFLFGLLQMAVYIVYPAEWVLPVAGLIVGTATNYIALTVLFNPVDPVTRCGCTLHGLFLQRQDEVAIAYGEIVSSKVINPPELVRALLQGKSSQKVFAMVHRRMSQCVDDYVASGRMLLHLTLGQHQFDQVKYELSVHMMGELPGMLAKVKQYTAEVLDVEATLRERMIQMPSADFEQLLHPVFEADEWKLILLGGVLGALVGGIQAAISIVAVTGGA